MVAWPWAIEFGADELEVVAQIESVNSPRGTFQALIAGRIDYR